MNPCQCFKTISMHSDTTLSQVEQLFGAGVDLKLVVKEKNCIACVNLYEFVSITVIQKVVQKDFPTKCSAIK